MSWRLAASGASLAAVLLAPGLLWLSVAGLPIPARVQISDAGR